MNNNNNNNNSNNSSKYNRNMCPVHNSRLQSKYYSDLDMLLIKCREKKCTEGHAIVEQYLEKKEKKKEKKEKWLKEQARKELKNINTVITEDSKEITSEM